MNSTYLPEVETRVVAPIFAQPVVSTVTPKVGDVLCGSYGYEASIATFAKVVAVTGKSVKVVELDQRCEYHPNSGGMYWTAFPLVNSTRTGKVVTKLVKASDTGYRIKWSSYQSLFGPWTGTSVECYNVH